MATSEKELEIEELLEEVDSLCETKVPENEFSIEILLDEILESTDAPSPPPASPALPKLPREETKKTQSYFTIWLTSALLFGLLAGSAFGYFWAHSRGIFEKPIVEPEKEIAIQISSWIEELKKVYDSLESIPPEEIIEPLDPPVELEQLAPSKLT